MFYKFYVFLSILSTMQHVRGRRALCCSINITWLEGYFYSFDYTEQLAFFSLENNAHVLLSMYLY